MRRFLRGVLGFTVLIVLAVALGTLVPRPLFVAESPIRSDVRTILVLTNPIHTDIAIPLDSETRARFAFLAADGVPVEDPAYEWLILGWGSRAFYLETPTWSELKAGPAFRALTVDSAVMHADVVGPLLLPHPSVTELEVAGHDFQRMLDVMDASFTRDEKGAPIVVADRSYGATDAFYEGEGLFNALVGCNVWAAGVLRAARIRTGVWNPLPQLLGLSLRLHND